MIPFEVDCTGNFGVLQYCIAVFEDRTPWLEISIYLATYILLLVMPILEYKILGLLYAVLDLDLMFGGLEALAYLGSFPPETVVKAPGESENCFVMNCL